MVREEGGCAPIWVPCARWRFGGDIDLHILAEADELVDLQRELAFSVELQDIIGEQKLDVVVRAPNEPRMPIDRVAMENGVLL